MGRPGHWQRQSLRGQLRPKSVGNHHRLRGLGLSTPSSPTPGRSLSPTGSVCFPVLLRLLVPQKPAMCPKKLSPPQIPSPAIQPLPVFEHPQTAGVNTPRVIYSAIISMIGSPAGSKRGWSSLSWDGGCKAGGKNNPKRVIFISQTRQNNTKRRAGTHRANSTDLQSSKARPYIHTGVNETKVKLIRTDRSRKSTMT